jgi:hypothetical protein
VQNVEMQSAPKGDACGAELFLRGSRPEAFQISNFKMQISKCKMQSAPKGGRLRSKIISELKADDE